MNSVWRTLWPGICAGILCLAPGSAALAQQAIIQQPTVGVFSGSSTVSVPDRGRTTIGGFSRGATSRSTYGPFPVGTNTGRSFEGGSLSVGAHIHDFEELDRQALSAAESNPRSGSSRPGGQPADRAYDSLMRRDRADLARSKKSGSSPAAVVAEEKQRGLNPDELLERGRKAEAAGKSGVAVAFYRQARDRGSADAARELDRLQNSRR